MGFAAPPPPPAPRRNVLDDLAARRREIEERLRDQAPEEILGVEEVRLREELAALDAGAWQPTVEPVQTGAARCEFCRRYGRLGICEGCGAPNVPAPHPPKPTFPPNRTFRG